MNGKREKEQVDMILVLCSAGCPLILLRELITHT